MADKKKKENLPCQKNDIVTVRIDDIGMEGEGIGKVEGYTLFIKDALMGDVVKALVIKTRKHFGYARLLEIIEASPYRVEPLCPVARQCGGCQLQHCDYEKQLVWKEKMVRDCLERIGGFTNIPMEPILSMETPYYYRNKAQFPVGVNRDGQLIAGFYAGRTHNIIENTDCAIQHPCNHFIVKTILEFMREYKISAYDEKTHTGLVRHILTRVAVATGEVMVCLVINGKNVPNSGELINRLLAIRLKQREGEPSLCIKSICLNINIEKTNVILGEKITVLYGESFIEDKIGKIKYRISPLSFYQVNPLQMHRLYETALEFAALRGDEVVWDLYCGIGTISLFLAQKAAKVCGVEIVPQAIEDARENADLNGFTNTEFYVGAAEDVVPQQYERSHGDLKADVVTLDPPRKGCEEKLLETVIRMEPSRIIYVSCNPATLARDLRYLCERGYELKRVRACDMFGMSHHVETVVLLSKGEVDSKKVRVEFSLEDMDMSDFQDNATYTQIKDYVLEHSGLKVSNLYISQIKRKCGIEVGKNREAFDYFGVI